MLASITLLAARITRCSSLSCESDLYGVTVSRVGWHSVLHPLLVSSQLIEAQFSQGFERRALLFRYFGEVLLDRRSFALHGGLPSLAFGSWSLIQLFAAIPRVVSNMPLYVSMRVGSSSPEVGEPLDSSYATGVF